MPMSSVGSSGVRFVINDKALLTAMAGKSSNLQLMKKALKYSAARSAAESMPRSGRSGIEVCACPVSGGSGGGDDSGQSFSGSRYTGGGTSGARVGLSVHVKAGSGKYGSISVLIMEYDREKQNYILCNFFTRELSGRRRTSS